MGDICLAAWNGDVGEVERLVGQDPSRLDARDEAYGRTPLVYASCQGHASMVRWLLDKGAAVNNQCNCGRTALWLACSGGRLTVVRLLLERGADPTIATQGGTTPLMIASHLGHLEVVRLLLNHPSAKVIVNNRDGWGQTALWLACEGGRGGVVRALLESGADFTIADHNGISPVAIAKTKFPGLPYGVTTKGRRESVALLEVSSSPPPHHLFSWSRG
jgi:uncharacterized protein